MRGEYLLGLNSDELTFYTLFLHFYHGESNIEDYKASPEITIAFMRTIFMYKLCIICIQNPV